MKHTLFYEIAWKASHIIFYNVGEIAWKQVNA